MKTTFCRECFAPICLMPTKKGKTAAVDAEPVYFAAEENGPNMYVQPGGGVIRGRVSREGDRVVRIGYRSHKDTCANRKRKLQKSERRRQG